jgi:hypothetical protein
MPTTQKVSTETILEALAAHPSRATMAARGEVELVGDKPLPDRRLAQARPGSSQLPAPGTPRGTDYPTSGVPTTPLVG